MKKMWIALVLVLVVMFSVSILAAQEEPESVDVDEWKSPVKDVLSANKIDLQEIELTNKTYYTFYVGFPSSLILENETYFDKAVRAIASANKFQSFKMEDSEKEIVVEVVCNGSSVTQISYNGNKNFFADLKAFQAAILKTVPEINDLAAKVAKNQGKLNFRIAKTPQADSADKYEKNYYVIEIVQIKGEEENALDECLISPDAKEILWQDAENEKYLTVPEWRKKIQTEPYWELGE